MGIFYGDIHYGVRISKRIENNDDIFVEPIYEVKFDDNTIMLNEYLLQVKNIYSNLLESETYQYELYVDISTTHNGVASKKGWQKITKTQMSQFMEGMYRIDFVKPDV